MFLGVDAGGTFTDFVLWQPGTPPRLRVHKTLSTPSSPEMAILEGIRALGLSDQLAGGRLHIIHGSTVATNAVLEGRLAKTALVTNTGFTDLLNLARQTRPALYQLEFAPQPEPVPEQLCFGIGGRVAADGTEVEALNEEDLQRLIEQLGKLDVEAVAINLLFSFLDDSHERRVETALLDSGLNIFVSRSSRVLPLYREYERGVATWLNAALGPVISQYLTRLQAGVGEATLQVMQSNGETLTASRAATSAVNLLLSGPAGGLTALQFLGEQINQDNFISFDMGGTSTDVALLSGKATITTEGAIADLPVAVPMVDMHTIGAGGGSIAFVDEGGMLQVGPRSAGAEPGPACYGKGGTEATVTDANLVLGRLLPTANLAGDLQLQIDLARRAIAVLGEKIGLGIEETAQGIVTIANEHMAHAIRLISVNRGHDPSQFLLASFGGAGGLHVCAVAEAMQMREAIVPVFGGVLSAFGMLAADQGRQFTRTVNWQLNGDDEAALLAQCADLQQQAEQELVGEGINRQQLRSQRSADLRYRGQSYTLNVPFESLTEARRQFAALHERRYGYRLNTDTEVVNLRVNVFSPHQPLQLPDHTPQACNKQESVSVYGQREQVPVLQRAGMEPGHLYTGPAIVVEYAATTYVAAGWQAAIDELGNLRLRST